MGESVLERINELARKAKAEGLTQEETAERDALRKKYLQNFRENMRKTIIDQIYIVEEDGTKTKLSDTKKQKEPEKPIEKK